MPKVLEAVPYYQAQGWIPIRIPPREKGPTHKGWNKPPYDTADSFRPQSNVGLLLGEPSGGLVDVDLDCDEALALADRILPSTPMVSGRAGSPRSHRWYRARIDTRVAYQDERGDTLVELRSTGCQTVVPPSLHRETGELCTWYSGADPAEWPAGDPAVIESSVLSQSVARLAALCVLAPHWAPLVAAQPPGSWSIVAAVSSLLVRSGWSWSQVAELLTPLAQHLGDGAAEQWLASADQTAALMASEPQSLPPGVEPLIARWLGLSPRQVTVTGAAPASSSAARPSQAAVSAEVAPSPPAVQTVDDRLRELQELVAQLQPTAPTWGWLAVEAHAAGVADHVVGLAAGAGDVARQAWQDGLAASRVGARPSAPTDDRRLLDRVRRALRALVAPATTNGGVVIRHIVHHLRARSLGGTLDLELATPEGAVWVRGLSGGQIRSYRTVQDRAAEVGLLLPALGSRKDATRTWDSLLAEAYRSRREVVEAPEEAELEAVLEQEILSIVAEAPRGETAKDLDLGQVIEADDGVLMATRALLRRVRDQLPDEPATRREILDAALALGARVEQERRIGTERRSVVVLPRTTLEPERPDPPTDSDEGAEAAT